MRKKLFNDLNFMNKQIAVSIINYLNNNKNKLLCFATGESTKPIFQLLVKSHEKKIIDLSKYYYIQLDEWVGLSGNNSGSCTNYLQKYLFKRININKKRIHYFNAKAKNLDFECHKANEFIKCHGNISLTLLGVGVNGHIGFNEPSKYESYAHVIDLDRSTSLVGQKYFQKDRIYEKGITLGMEQLMNSEKIIVTATGKNKSTVINKLVKARKVDPSIPVTNILDHKDAYLYIDYNSLGD